MENIIDEEFFQQKSSAMKLVYYVHSLAGGMYYEEYVTTKFKYCSRILLGFSYAIAVGGNVARLIRQQETDFRVIEDSVAQLIFMHMWITIILMIYLKRDTFHALFDYMSTDLNDSIARFIPSNAMDEEMKNKIKRFNIRVSALEAIGLAMVFFGKMIHKVSTFHDTGEFQIDYDWDFFSPFPFTISQTVFAYVFVNILTFISVVVEGMIIFGSFTLPIVLKMCLEHRMNCLLNDIKVHSELAFDCLDECSRREKQILNEDSEYENVRAFRLRENARQRDRHIEEFMWKVRQWIVIHQKWMRGVELFKKSVSQITTVFISAMYMGIIVNGYHLTKMILDSEEEGGYQFVFYMVFDISVLFMACSIGDSLYEASDSLSDAIYSMPWYYLPKKHQKVLLNFLCLAQNDNEMRIFNVFPLCLELLPKILNDAYGNVQIMRVLEMKK